MSTVITVYELPAEGPAPADPGDGHRRHRALGRPPAAFGWIDLAEVGSADEAGTLVEEAAARPGALPGAYDVFHVGERAAAPYAPDAADASVIFVNCMRVPPGREDAAFEAWSRVNAYMVTKAGYRWHRLHRRVDDTAPFGLVNVVEWESPEAWQAAHDEGFRALTDGELPFTAHPTLCRPLTASVTNG